MKLLLGLGNPGTAYVGTRHNVGRASVEALTHRETATWKKDVKRHANIAKISFDRHEVLLARTTVYMNESGQALQALLSYYKIGIEDVLVVQDEMDLAPGRLAFLRDGGPAGHNGITDIHRALGRTDICRLRIGVGRPPTRKPAEDWVLERPSDDDAAKIDDTVIRCMDAMEDWVLLGPEQAMTTWNRK
ncbi:aminoacyl-tRNA hydrolase [Patescibacteria group bacterium]|nr:aminoacyl-tRNA hydrolase [Patescibacteria group bacterium]MBU1448669.1 aminoacyl-tRNA hydrolase [Patescibacteria group bacterium]MBU2612919.1 aminoacyl-tRNA hydrolase [Patescibacteria group bacterium]